jgi:hypothetical protein
VVGSKLAGKPYLGSNSRCRGLWCLAGTALGSIAGPLGAAAGGAIGRGAASALGASKGNRLKAGLKGAVKGGLAGAAVGAGQYLHGLGGAASGADVGGSESIDSMDPEAMQDSSMDNGPDGQGSEGSEGASDIPAEPVPYPNNTSEIGNAPGVESEDPEDYNYQEDPVAAAAPAAPKRFKNIPKGGQQLMDLAARRFKR